MIIYIYTAYSVRVQPSLCHSRWNSSSKPQSYWSEYRPAKVAIKMDKKNLPNEEVRPIFEAPNLQINSTLAG